MKKLIFPITILAYVVAGLLVVRGLFVLVKFTFQEPPVTRGTNVVADAHWEYYANKIETNNTTGMPWRGTEAGRSSAYEVPSKAHIRAHIDATNEFEISYKARVQGNDGRIVFEVSTNALMQTVWTFSTNYLSAEDPNEVTVTFHSKDGSVWTPTWTKQ